MLGTDVCWLLIIVQWINDRLPSRFDGRRRVIYHSVHEWIGMIIGAVARWENSYVAEERGVSSTFLVLLHSVERGNDATLANANQRRFQGIVRCWPQIIQ